MNNLPKPDQMRKELLAAGWKIKRGYWCSPSTGKPVLALNFYMPWMQMRKEAEQEAVGHG